MTELSPCPFCGQTSALEIVICNASTDDKRGGCGSQSGFKLSQAEAVTLWNSRAIAPSLSDSLCAGCTETCTEPQRLRTRITELEAAFDRCIEALADARSGISGGLYPDDIAERDSYREILGRKI